MAKQMNVLDVCVLINVTLIHNQWLDLQYTRQHVANWFRQKQYTIRATTIRSLSEVENNYFWKTYKI